MNEQQQQPGDSSPAQSTGCLPVVLRTMWMGWGLVALILCAIKMAEGPDSPASTILFLALTVALIAARYVDIARFGGETAHGEPADLSHWRRYAAGIVVLSASLWGLASVSASRGWM